MMITWKHGLTVALFFTVFFYSCEENTPFRKVEPPAKPLPYQSDRMDHSVFQADYTDLAAARQQLYQNYDDFLCIYLEQILRIGHCDSLATIRELNAFATWPDMMELQREVDRVFPDTKTAELDNQFKLAIGRWHTLFPDSLTPRVVYMNSGLNFSAFSTDEVLATGLDYFLGPENSVAQKLPADLFPMYLKEDMLPEYAVTNTIKDFCQREVSQSVPYKERPDMLHLLIFHGKVMYLLDLLMPEESDAVKMNWTEPQQKWAEENEWNTWKELAKQEIMFNTSMRDNIRWFDFGPFTNAGNVPQESPPQLGIWMGWRIVRTYMNEHPEVSVQEMLSAIPDPDILRSYKAPK
jgi:hypothetical protein